MTYNCQHITAYQHHESVVHVFCRLPSWYKSAIFNELYFVSDGGSVWLDKLDDNSEREVHATQLINDYGKFAYLEGRRFYVKVTRPHKADCCIYLYLVSRYSIYVGCMYSKFLKWPIVSMQHKS